MQPPVNEALEPYKDYKCREWVLSTGFLTEASKWRNSAGCEQLLVVTSLRPVSTQPWGNSKFGMKYKET